uniref:NADH-ubiquinone oxidoreductase chain 5 n=1 Tax=Pygmaeocidaris prionigera TaxID=2803191 RepID=A0A886RHN1_9ECHN|nr:NADH dehydrogenase subunit 5 [Pygmaeocidaris prionigera]QQV69856.1 NADH dehydrogenase subunit 5 [Pygmaeocidaris prionigera]
MVINPSLLLISITLSILFILLISTLYTSKSFLFQQKNEKSETLSISGATYITTPNTSLYSWTNGPFSINVLKLLAALSLITLFMQVNLNFQETNITFTLWLSNTATNLSLNIILDQYALIFLTVALVVTWSIMEFSHYYMEEDPNKNAFFLLLTVFLLNMLILTCSNSLFLLFLGWEGVGFLSFLLISWWTTRNDASSSALEAVIYNRIGDIGLILFMAISALTLNSWNLNEILAGNSTYTPYTPFLLFGIILAAAGKSAQFGLHPWLPAAMEGPTPVSALLHSSTMVVAGVFLLVRTSSLFDSSPFFQTIVLLLGGTTALFAASTAIAQHDIKKIIAYSTTSQLGLMVTAIGIGQPLLAFFHICTHAFFKAMLFLCSGSIIHSLSDEQDLRKMGGLSKLLPITSACLTLGSLALMGIPFLAGFYSKDLILEAAGASLLNTLGLSMGLIATLLTASYSFRIIFFCFTSNPSINSLSPIGEENINLGNALMRLSLGTIISGWFFSNFVFTPPSFIVSTTIKSLPLLITILGIVLLFVYLSYLSTTVFNQKIYSTLSSQWFFAELTHTTITFYSFLSSLFLINRSLDRGWQEEIGPQGISKSSIHISQLNQRTQTGLIKQYITSSLLLIGFIVILAILST